MYYRPKKLSEALEWLADEANENGQIAAGCTDLFPASGASKLVGPILDITAIDALRAIEKTGDRWSFGGAATWTQLIRHDLPAAFDGLKLAAREVGSIQIQNSGTLAGNLCNASPAADGTPCWLTLDAHVTLESVRGRRELPLTDFMKGPRRTALAKDEILTTIRVRSPADKGRSGFLKLGARKYLVISIAMVAARLVDEAGVVADCAISVGSCSGVPVRLEAVERALIGKPVDEHLADHIDHAAVADYLSPISDIRGDQAYRLNVAGELVSRCVGQLAAGDVQVTA